MGSTSWGTRKVLGRRYGTDPALLMEAKRLEEEYGLMPGRESRALQAAQFQQSLEQQNKALAQNQSQFDDTQAANKQAGMVGTAANVATTGAIVRGMSMGPNDKFWGNWGSTPEAPSAVMQGTPTATTGIQSASNPAFYTGPSTTTQGASYGVTPSTIDASTAGAAPVGATSGAAAYGSQGGIGTGIGAMESGVGSVTPYLGPIAAGYSGPKLLEQAWPGSNENLGHNLSLGLLKGEKDANVLGRTASGAIAGAAAGSVIPVVGTAAGAVVGGVVGFISSVFGW
jgi:hypothetical protein